jgi:hypothetical protein
VVFYIKRQRFFSAPLRLCGEKFFILKKRACKNRLLDYSHKKILDDT